MGGSRPTKPCNKKLADIRCMNERRFEGRFLCADLVRVDWLEGGERLPDAPGAFWKIFLALGACVQVEERIPPGTGISIAADVGRWRRCAVFRPCFVLRVQGLRVFRGNPPLG